MGEYFKFVNPSQRQYNDSLDFGEGIKNRGILRKMYGLTLAYPDCKGAGNDNPSLPHDYAM